MAGIFAGFGLRDVAILGRASAAFVAGDRFWDREIIRLIPLSAPGVKKISWQEARRSSATMVAPINLQAIPVTEICLTMTTVVVNLPNCLRKNIKGI